MDSLNSPAGKAHFDVFITAGNDGLVDPNTHTAGNWYKWCGTKVGSSTTLYRNGSAVAGPTSYGATLNTTTAATTIGATGGTGSPWFSGLIDEVRFDIPRSVSWEASEFANQNAPATFIAPSGSPLAVIAVVAYQRARSRRLRFSKG